MRRKEKKRDLGEGKVKKREGEESRYKKCGGRGGRVRRMCGQVGEPQTDECRKVGFSRMRLMGNRKQTDSPRGD